MKLGCTGTQKGMTLQQVHAVESFFYKRKPTEAHHGDCIGSDEQFDGIAFTYDVPVVLHPPIDETKRAHCEQTHSMLDVRKARPYLERDFCIVLETDELLATPKGFEEELRSGTWATVRMARKQKKPVTIVWPDGGVDVSPS